MYYINSIAIFAESKELQIVKFTTCHLKTKQYDKISCNHIFTIFNSKKYTTKEKGSG